MPLTVLSVAYPLAPVGPDAVGGAEQILSALERALVAAGHRSLVVASDGSRVQSELIALPAPAGELWDDVKRMAQVACRETLRELLRTRPVDLVHFHGVDFHTYQPEAGPPMLATLHLPPEFYPSSVFQAQPGLHLHCVSAAQRARCPTAARLLADIPNGVDLSTFRPAPDRGGYAVLLSRICPEKGVHLALDAARAAGVPLVIAGRVYPYPEHLGYFASEVAPRLDGERRFVGPLGMRAKAELLARARCLIVPSLVEETSSLVAMEALASGTPVVALRAGALPEIVEHGHTGWIATEPAELAECILRAPLIRARDCRAAAERRFSLERMCQRYLGVYASVTGGARKRVPRRSGREPGVRISEFRTVEALQLIHEEWAGLWARCPEATVFQSPEWLLSWSAHLLRGELHLLALRDSGKELVGIAPLFSWNAEGRRVVSLMGAGVSDYQDALFDPKARGQCLAALEGWFADTASSWDRVEWSELPGHSPLLDARLLRLSARREIAMQEVCPGLDLQQGGSLETLLPRARARELAYARRRAARECGLAYEEVQLGTFDDLFTSFEHLHRRRWSGRAQLGRLTDARVVDFHRYAARALAEAGRLMLHAVRLDEQRAAVLYGFHDARSTRYYSSGFEPHYSKYSPGLLAIAHGIEEALSRGKTTFDFLRGAESYKYAWGARDRCRLYRLTVLSPKAAAGAAPTWAAVSPV